MGINPLAAQLGGLMAGQASLTQKGILAMERFFHSKDAVQQVEFYNEIVKRFGELKGGWRNFDRLADRLAHISDGDGAEIYTGTVVNPTPGQNYSPVYNDTEAAKYLFGQWKPDVRQFAIAQPRRWHKALTVMGDRLRAGFVSSVETADEIISSLQNSDRLDEWYAVMDMLFHVATLEGAYKVTGPAITDEESARNFSARLGSFASFLGNPSNRYNPGRATMVYDRSTLRLVARTSFIQKLQKSSYANAFNPEYMRGLSDDLFIDIPDADWPASLSNVQGILITKADEKNSTLVVKDNMIHSSAPVNETNLAVNHNLLHQSVYGVNPYAPLVVFVDGVEEVIAGTTPVPTEVTIKAFLNGNEVTELRRGYEYQFEAIAKGANGYPAGRAATTLTGSESDTGFTYLDADQLILNVAIDETAESLTLTAKSVIDGTISATVTLPVTGEAFQSTPPFTPLGEGGDAVNLTPGMLATKTGNVVTPPADPQGYTLTYSGVVGGTPTGTQDFTSPVTLTEEGDTITVTATPAEGITLTGTTTRTLTYTA